MAFLTIFSAPKPFTNPHIATIQTNAILSWKHLGHDVEVLLVGNEPGLEEFAIEHKIKLLPDVRRNEKGTPLVSSIFKLARSESQSPVLTYVNADIILLPEITTAAKQVNELLSEYLVIGQRWDLDVHNRLDFSSGWDKRMKEEVANRGRLHPPAGSDYFIYPRTIFRDIPDFAIGRAGWDNWMIYYARQKNWTVIDGTPSIMVIHQDHDYSHLSGGKPHYNLDESRNNTAMAGGSANLYMVLDCQKQLRDGKIYAPQMNFIRLLRRGEVWLTPANGKRQGWRWSVARYLRRWRRRLSGSLPKQ
jgi:hypothetical protein